MSTIVNAQFDAGIHPGIFTLSRVEFAIYLQSMRLC